VGDNKLVHTMVDKLALVVAELVGSKLVHTMVDKLALVVA